MDRKSIGQQGKISSSSPLSRRAFLAGAATCAAAGPALLHAAVCELGRPTLLHVATCTSHSGYVQTFASTSVGCTLLGSTAIDSLAAVAAHPALPVLYVARDCREWENLPRGVIESYAVEHGAHPLRLLAQTPMALSATGPRSLAVSSCGGHLLVTASTGGAWNAFTLNRDGMPTSIAIARKEIGSMFDAHTVSLPTPHGLAFSPQQPVALSTDPGTGWMTLLQPSPESIAVLARCQTPHGLTRSSPVFTSDGRYIMVANAKSASLSVYEMSVMSGEGSNADFHLLGTTPTISPVTTLLAHPVEPAVFTSRPQGNGSCLELWKIHGSDLRVAADTWVAGYIVTMAQNAGSLWVLSDDRLTRIQIGDLRTPHRFEAPLATPGAQAIVVQTMSAHLASARS
ncbi:MAG: beta-propeller fold lactonase family protein [Candidatus Sulfotelmatobacter sp.]